GGGTATNQARLFISLKPIEKRDYASAEAVIERLRPAFVADSQASLFLQAAQDVQVGGRSGNAQYQYTLQAEDIPTLHHWAPLPPPGGGPPHTPPLGRAPRRSPPAGRATRGRESRFAESRASSIRRDRSRC